MSQLANAIIEQDAEMQKLQRRLYVLEPVARAADELEAWLGTNAGDSRDWVRMIFLDNSKEENRLLELLEELSEKLKPYRAAKKVFHGELDSIEPHKLDSACSTHAPGPKFE